MKNTEFKILGVIPARGGSKGIPNKNIKDLSGKPLIYYTIIAAQQSTLLSETIVSTDSMLIKEVAETFGANVPFLRPNELSHDTALAIPTIQHAVRTYEGIVGFKYDYVVMLQPTAPLREASDIDNSLKILIDSQNDSIISITDVDNYHPYKMKEIRNDKLCDFIDTGMENPPRQLLPSVYIVNGAIYAVKRDILMNNNSFKGNLCLPFIMTRERSVNIDNYTDFLVAEYYLKNKVYNG
jgi:CMP-N,N'-diacetyllegionaminic acid synthase